MDISGQCSSNHQDGEYDKCETSAMYETGNTGEDIADHVLKRRPNIWTRHVIGRLCGMYLAMATVGLAHSLLGSILLEIQFQTGADIDKLTLLFTWSSLGRLLSSFTIGAIFDRLHAEMQLGLATLLTAVCTIIVPLSRLYAVVAVAITIQGFCIGFISTGTSANTFNVVSEFNGKAGPFVQANYFAFAFGCVLGPFVAEPFLSAPEQNGNITHFDNDTKTHTSGDMMIALNDTSSTDTLLGYVHAGSFYPNLILALCACFPTIISIVQFSMDKCQIKRPKRRSNATDHGNTSMVIRVLFMVAFFCSVGVEVTYMGMMYTYTVQVHRWLPKTANHLLTVYWTMFALCRASSIPLARHIQPRHMLAGAIATMVAMLILLVAANHVSRVVLWITAAGMGMATSIQMGTWFLLGNQYMPVTGRVAACFTTSVYTGCIIIPAISGFVFKYIDLSWFPLILLIFSVLLLVDFIAIQCVGKKYLIPIID
jgi:fucose permease